MATFETNVRGSAVEFAALNPPHRLKMGISFLPSLDRWLIIDRDRPRDLEEKRRLTASSPDRVWVEQPESRDAQTEVSVAVAEYLKRFTDIPATEPRGAPLLHASLLVQEDLCLLERDANGWCLTAASVCFPSRWDLSSKLGRTLAGIHEPVPGYSGKLESSADQFFDALRPGRIAVRSNWSLMTDSALHQPATATSAAEPIKLEHAPSQVILRTERQTLRRFERTGCILFTIRTFRDPLEVLADRPAAARRLADAIRAMPAELVDYKALSSLRPATLDCLDAWSQSVDTDPMA